MLCGGHEPKRIKLRRASINVFRVDQPKLEGDQKQKTKRQPVAAQKLQGGV